MGASQQTKEARLANGLCQRCGNNPFRPNTKTCESCFQKTSGYDRIDRERRKEKGICQKCASPVVTGKVHCEKHLSLGKSRAKELTDWRKSQGLCTACGKEKGFSPSKRECIECYLKHSTARAKRYQRWTEQGLCGYCGGERVSESVVSCRTCFFKILSQNHFDTNKRYQELQELYESQEGKCAILGWDLPLGIDASLDHIIPSSRGGKNDLSNLRFVFKWLNDMKKDDLDEVFLPKLANCFQRIREERFWFEKDQY